MTLLAADAVHLPRRSGICSRRTFFTRVAMADLRDLLYTRAFSDVLCRCSEFCLASTWNTLARTGAGRREAAARDEYGRQEHAIEGQIRVG